MGATKSNRERQEGGHVLSLEQPGSRPLTPLSADFGTLSPGAESHSGPASPGTEMAAHRFLGWSSASDVLNMRVYNARRRQLYRHVSSPKKTPSMNHWVEERPKKLTNRLSDNLPSERESRLHVPGWRSLPCFLSPSRGPGR